MRKTWKWLLPLLLLTMLAGGFFIFTATVYRADAGALAAMHSDAAVSVLRTDSGWLFDGPAEDTALIFYPGARVEAEAYAPLLHRLAAEGMDVYLVAMPFHLAVFGQNKAADIIQANSYSTWFIGRHSLGGAVAANYAATHGEGLTGLVLCAAYPTKKLPEGLIEISIYGSEDGVLDPERLAEGRAFAPERAVENVIEGGNHAQFGNYGLQAGDGTARISAEDQQLETVQLIAASVFR